MRQILIIIAAATMLSACGATTSEIVNSIDTDSTAFNVGLAAGFFLF